MLTFKKNPPTWSDEDMLDELNNFIPLYKNRPIKNNSHGMKFPHMFAVFFILKKLKPNFIIESGVYRGQSTWLIEKTLPDAQILSIDIDLSKREYISDKVEYSNLDFKYHDFSIVPSNTLVFFDDHQPHMDRIKQSKFFGIKNIIFEDNYPPGFGDFPTLRYVYSNKDFNHTLTFLNIIKTTYLLLTQFFKKITNNNYLISLDQINSRLRDRRSNINDFKNLDKNIETYYEFPPIYEFEKTFLGIDTKKKEFKTEKPFLKILNSDILEFKNELNFYNYITYIKLK
jgi:hypothetical protein